MDVLIEFYLLTMMVLRDAFNIGNLEVLIHAIMWNVAKCYCLFHMTECQSLRRRKCSYSYFCYIADSYLDKYINLDLMLVELFLLAQCVIFLLI